ncbi:MAG: hypothetical protein IPI64_10430 [Chloracidobacterium sp.]|nr:hypothetical protein [Chloracidobacterium sp.]
MPPQPVCVAQPSGTISWWRGEGNTNDSVGTNNGSLIGGATYAPGKVGQAFSFNGTTAAVDIPDSDSLDVTNQFTLAAWVNPTVVPAYPNGALVISKVGGLSNLNGFQMAITNISGQNQIWCGFNQAGGPWAQFSHTGGRVNPGEWTYIACTYDDNAISLYVNGQPVGAAGVGHHTVANTSSHVKIGSDDVGQQFYSGLIDEPMIAGRALSGTELLAIYDAGSAGICPACAPPPSGMVSMWAAENNPFDSLGRNNGVLTNGTTFTSGILGQAFSFDGVDDYVEIPDSPSLDVTRISMSFWFKINQLNRIHELVNKFGPEGSNTIAYGAEIGGNNRVCFRISTDGTLAGLTDLCSTTTLTTDTWYHFAGTYDGSDMKLYINGINEGSVSKSGDIFVSTQNLKLGSYGYHGWFLNGALDEVSVFNRSLSGAEIQAIHNARGAGFCSTCTPAPVGLASWWSGDGIASDIRGFDNGIAEGALTFTAGKVAQGFNFDGSSADIRIPASSGLDVGVRSGMTIDMWIKPTTVTNNPLAEWGSGVTGAHFWLGGSEVPGNLYINLTDTGGNFHVLQSAGGVIAPNEWQHVAMTYDKASGIATLYRNGSIVAGPTNLGSFTPRTNSDLYLGYRVSPAYRFGGLMDEVELLDRALTAEEIQRIVNAGSAGKCKPTAATPPSGQISWWAGDGDGRTLTSTGYNALLYNGANFRVGKVGQAFNFDGIDDYLEVAGNIGSFGGDPFSIELWMRSSNVGNGAYVIGKSYPDGGTGWDIRLHDQKIRLEGTDGWAPSYNWESDQSVTPNAWHHLAVSANASQISVYIDGVLKGTTPRGVISSSPNPFRIGFTTNYGGTPFNGLMDEIALYDRALTLTEVQSIYNAGFAGKLKQEATLVPGMRARGTKRSAVVTNVTIGDATVSFPSVTANGVTHEIPLDPVVLPPLPLRTLGLTYDIATSAQYTDPLTLCFHLPSFTTTEFATLRILHLENGGWVDVTSHRQRTRPLCAVGLTSLSPFAIVTTAPTAAELSIAGRVVTAEGRGIRGAFVTVTGTGGDVRNVATGNLGRYVVDGLNAGETYIVTVRSRRFTFAQPTRVITLNDNVTDADFIGSSGTGREQ